MREIESEVRYTARVIAVGEENALIQIYYKNKKLLGPLYCSLSMFSGFVPYKGENVLCVAREFKDKSYECFFVKHKKKSNDRYTALLRDVGKLAEKIQELKEMKKNLSKII